MRYSQPWRNTCARRRRAFRGEGVSTGGSGATRGTRSVATAASHQNAEWARPARPGPFEPSLELGHQLGGLLRHVGAAAVIPALDRGAQLLLGDRAGEVLDPRVGDD